jgi:tRNA(His) guanylyltransferase
MNQNTTIPSDTKSDLNDRMKKYEAKHDSVIPSDHYFCVRLDGHTFSKFTKGFRKPYDELFSKTMVMCSHDLMKEFRAQSAYTQSDEITLVFIQANLESKQSHIYNGRIQKIVSLTAAFASVRFNKYLSQYLSEYLITNPEQTIYKQATINKINGCSAYFDARILVFEPELKHEILNHMIWRSPRDCYRNAIQSYACHLFGNKKIHKLNQTKMIELINQKISWEDVPLWQKFGVFIKKNLTNVDTEHGTALRSKIMCISFRLIFSDQNVEFFLSDYYLEPTAEKIENFGLISI